MTNTTPVNISITISNTDQRAEIAARLQSALESVSDLTENLEISIAGLEYTYEEWEFGEPCPECGHEEFHVQEPTYSIYEKVGENVEFKRRANGGHHAFLSVMCNNPDCHLQLQRTPASFLMK